MKAASLLDRRRRLSEEQAAAIRRRGLAARAARAALTDSDRELAAEFGVSVATVRSIVTGWRWKEPLQVSPPKDARDPKEGVCFTCIDWFAWRDLVACGDCGETFCEDHRDPEDHHCPGPER